VPQGSSTPPVLPIVLPYARQKQRESTYGLSKAGVHPRPQDGRAPQSPSISISLCIQVLPPPAGWACEIRRQIWNRKCASTMPKKPRKYLGFGL
jgi:hypothetical protein